ncbi:UDP-N-acetylmuramoyl-L-alanine--D-glutamate ligase [soil metagenome]
MRPRQVVDAPIAVPVAGERALVVGLAVTGQAVAAALARRGVDVVAVDDAPSPAVRAAASELGIDLVVAPSAEDLAVLVGSVSAVVPSPGLPERHRVFALAAAAGVPLRSELDLAAAWDRRPCLAVTGTDGKTTVTTMVAEMLEASGRRAVAAGNTEVPLVAAIDDPAVEVFVVEASSFRLATATGFRPQIATWLNFAADHLDIHRSLVAYEAAKARIGAALRPGATAVANADDPVVMGHARSLAEPAVTFGLVASRRPDYHVADGVLRTADGADLVAVDDLSRSLPHDQANALAAAATALTGGANLVGVRRVLRSFRGLPHRVALVGESGGVRYYDDSKATAPHAARAAIGGFDSVVLIAGGRNKGLDLRPLAEDSPRVRAVVAIGEAAGEIAAAFAGHRPVHTATSMDEAVALAADLARSGDAVLLSPACASFDWYRSYGERGDDFARAVRAHLADGGAP